MIPKPTIPKLSKRNSANQELAHIRERGNGDWGTGLGFEAGNEAGFDADKERAREGVKGGTARDDERHVARKPRMDAGGRRVPRRAEENRGGGE